MPPPSRDEPSLLLVPAAAATPGGTPGGTPAEDTDRTDTEASLKPSPAGSPLGAIVGRFRSRGKLQLPRPRRRRLWIAVAAVVVVLALGLGLGLGLGLRKRHEEVDTSGPVIHLSYASYRGTQLHGNISQFLGLRYAEPPLGSLRWRAPLPPSSSSPSSEHEDSHDGIRQAKAFAPICLGISDGDKDSHDEDCLFANVWAPTNATADMKLPVMVFIQGGGYTRNANANWNGTRLVETSGNGIVFVNFNYRVGLWGFLAGEAVREDGDLNVGLLDQRRLLQWVQEHIHNFGGDPNHVVIQGVSAGAGSVALHLVAHGGRNDNLFVGAISESTFIPAHPPVSDVEYQFDRTIEQAGCQDDDSPINCLRDMSQDDLQALNVPGPFPGRTGYPLFYWTPCIDGDLLQDSPTASFTNGKFFEVPLLFGTCTDEGTVFASDASSPDDLTSFLQDNYPSLNSSQTADIIDLYPEEPELPFHNAYFPSAARAYGEATFICPVRNILNHVNATDTTWSYRYDVQQADTVDSGLGVPHVAEVPAVMGPDMLSYPANPSYTTYNANAVPLVMNYWLSFVKTLDPNPERLTGSLEWEPWARNQSRIVIKTRDSVMEKVGDGENSRCEFWEEIGPLIRQ